MDVKDLMKDVGKITEYDFNQRLERLINTNYHYQNLGTANKKLVFDIVKKYKSYLRKGVGISAYTISQESYHLYQNRIKLDLSDEDLKDIKEILGYLKK